MWKPHRLSRLLSDKNTVGLKLPNALLDLLLTKGEEPGTNVAAKGSGEGEGLGVQIFWEQPSTYSKNYDLNCLEDNQVEDR